MSDSNINSISIFWLAKLFYPWNESVRSRTLKYKYQEEVERIGPDLLLDRFSDLVEIIFISRGEPIEERLVLLLLTFFLGFRKQTLQIWKKNLI